MMNSSVDPAKLTGIKQVMDDVLIRHRSFKTALARLDECMQSFTGYGEPVCMLLHGPAGVGKSTVAKAFLAENNPYDADDRRVIPVLNAVIPVPATMKNMATELLDKLGDPLSDRGTLEQRTKRLRKLLSECRTKLIILDEFQHFIDRKSDRVILDVSDWLKNLISNTSIPVVLVGLPYSLSVLSANEQLMRRFSYQTELSPFDWEDKADRSEFTKILNAIDGKLASVLGGNSNLKDQNVRCHAATKGLISLLIKLIYGAAYEATKAGGTSITQQHLAQAFRARLVPDRKVPNPFLDSWKGQKIDPLPESRHLHIEGCIASLQPVSRSMKLNDTLSAR
ncbi:MAG: TniB family NTP-binding protein [Thalassospira sp.]|uniref:TniB family NTP-binding protein n=1 Tax=Thalassospira sp. TaxID=1912094 RepID=UPI003A89A3BF